MNGLNDFDKTDREYSLAPTDVLIRFWKSNIKVIAGRQGQILSTPCVMSYLSNLNETYQD